MVSKKYKFIFVHIPKSAGISIRSALEKYADVVIYGHFNIEQIINRSKSKNITHTEAESYFKFGFVRNPWDRFVSCFNYFKHYGNRVYMDVHNGNIINRYKSFHEFVLDFPNMHGEFKDRHFLPQTTWTHELDFIGRFENINNDFAKICKICKLPNIIAPHHNKSKTNQQNYRSYYNDKTADIIRTHYQQDIDTLGYEY